MFLAIRKVELIKKKKFIIAIFNLNYKTFIVYITTFNISFNSIIEVYSLKRAQIVYLKINKIFTKIFNKYANFINIFFLKLAIKFLKYMSINNYIIELIDN